MTWIFGGLGLLVLVLGFIWFMNRKAFGDFWKASRAQVGKLGDRAARADPKAMIDQEIRDADAELNNAIGGLEESKGLVKELEAQVKEDAREVANLDRRIQGLLNDDMEDKNGKAANDAVKLNGLKQTAEKNLAQFEMAKSLYANNLEKFRLAQTKIRQAQEKASGLGMEIKNSETNARLATLAKNFNVGLNGLDSALSQAMQEAKRQIARNNAVSEVQADLGADGLEEARQEERLQKAAAKSVLDEYRAKMNKS